MAGFLPTAKARSPAWPSSTLRPTAVWEASELRRRPAADSSGNLFLVTGNGSYDTTNPQIDYGDSILKVTFANNAFAVADYFTPYNQASLSGGDVDLGSGGVLLLPESARSNPNELVEAGKQGTIYLVSRDTMTTTPLHYCNGRSSDPEIVQESTAGKIAECGPCRPTGITPSISSAPGARLRLSHSAAVR